MSPVCNSYNVLLALWSLLSRNCATDNGTRIRAKCVGRNSFIVGCTVTAMLLLLTVCLLPYTGTQPLQTITSRYRQHVLSPPTTYAVTQQKTVRFANVVRKLGLKFISNSTNKLTPGMNASEMDVNFFQFISKLHYDCEDYIRLGHSYDGGWDMCLVGQYRPTQPCLIYSFGISWDFSFDDASSIRFGCTVRSFDPSMTDTADHRRDANIWFYQTGIGGKDEKTAKGWTLKTLQTLMKELNDTTKTIDYLKIDVESAEWDILPNMFSTGVLDNVKQLGLEIHVIDKTFYRYWRILNGLEQRGFRRWYWAMNYRGPNIYLEKAGPRSYGYELVYINTKYIEPGIR